MDIRLRAVCPAQTEVKIIRPETPLCLQQIAKNEWQPITARITGNNQNHRRRRQTKTSSSLPMTKRDATPPEDNGRERNERPQKQKQNNKKATATATATGSGNEKRDRASADKQSQRHGQERKSRPPWGVKLLPKKQIRLQSQCKCLDHRQ